MSFLCTQYTAKLSRGTQKGMPKHTSFVKRLLLMKIRLYLAQNHAYIKDFKIISKFLVGSERGEKGKVVCTCTIVQITPTE